MSERGDILRSILRSLACGECKTLRDLLRAVNVDERDLKLLLGAAVAEGLVVEEELVKPCEACPLRPSCSVVSSSGRSSALRVYRLTERGARLLNANH
ncbi:MAG: hypothetical protein QW405_01895 [Fervidicoccaceae archaeon]